MVLWLGCMSRPDDNQRQETSLRINECMGSWSSPKITSISTIPPFHLFRTIFELTDGFERLVCILARSDWLAIL